MHGTESDQTTAGRDLSDLTERWVSAVRASGYLAPDGDQLRVFLHELVRRMAGALRAPAEHERVGHDVGVALVRARLTAPEVLRDSITTLARLPAEAGLAGRAVEVRLGELLGGLSAGFCAAERERTLMGQERIRAAALAAVDTAEHARRDSEARLRAVFSAAGTAIAIADLRGRLVEANPAVSLMLGIPAAELVGRRVLDFFHPDDVPSIRQEIVERLLGSGGRLVRMEKRFVDAAGTTGWMTLSVSLVHGDDGRPAYLVAMAEDVTDRHRLQTELHHQAHHDPLTGLPNRTLLYRWLKDTIAAATPDRRVGVCFLDLDDFKIINDTLGHGIGDQLLVAVAGRLHDRVTGAGHVIARVGGDEFVVLLRDTDGPGQVTALAEQLLEVLDTPVEVEGHRLTVSASIGVLERPAYGEDFQEVLRAADATLYLAKADGRGRWALFDPDRNAAQMRRYDLAGRLPEALRRGEFQLEYQPIVSLTDHRLRGAEALLRWHHPELGRLSPNTFIPVAEQSGVIVALGRWVLRQACADAARWQDGGPPRFVSVNVSMRQFTEPDLADEVARALRDSGLPPQALQLEITESAVMQSYDRPVATLQAIADMGVRIVIDDFGTGYSNLAHLRHLPVHGLKLAGAFMAGMRLPTPDRVDEQIVETVVRLAHMLGMSVTAEGVETAEQAERLATLGSDLAQGWHFGPAGRPEQIGEYPHHLTHPAT
ncbi:EAL domain-containing protein [Polymorphospora sp. NPDC051019]|uniref:putative bifunctional diguanylate cyclase/phosphodiesterase n=1 Tax=Polymorphospora sp. NPDC051019 TaxID=3155725 RepID=UPI00341266BF